MKKLNTTALFYATHATIWLVVLLTVASEKVKPLKLFLASLTGHHWTAKGAISLIFFFIIVAIFSKARETENVFKASIGVLITVVMGFVIIFGFYMLHFFGLA